VLVAQLLRVFVEQARQKERRHRVGVVQSVHDPETAA